MAATLTAKPGRECPRRRESPGSSSEVSPQGTVAGRQRTRGPRRGQRHGRRACGMSDRPRLHVDVDGGLVRLRGDYHPELVKQIRALPGRRFIRERGEWVLPASREALADVAALVERLGEDARLSGRARRRLERARPGRIESRDGQFELSFAFNPRRLARVRSIPERRYQPEGRGWTVAPTRAGALALLALIEEGDFAAEPELAARLTRMATARELVPLGAPDSSDDRAASEEQRSSPVPHWRHVTRGPIFDANPHRQEWVEGIGWCVRVRVDPTRHRAGKR